MADQSRHCLRTTLSWQLFSNHILYVTIRSAGLFEPEDIVKHFCFPLLDRDGDGNLTMEELEAAIGKMVLGVADEGPPGHPAGDDEATTADDDGAAAAGAPVGAVAAVDEISPRARLRAQTICAAVDSGAVGCGRLLCISVTVSRLSRSLSRP